MNVSIDDFNYIKKYRQIFDKRDDISNKFIWKVYLEANGLDQFSKNARESEKTIEYRNYVIDHLNQSLIVSSPIGRLNSYIKAFLDKYIELRN